MDSLYNDSKLFYKQLIHKIVSKNAAFVDGMKLQSLPREELVFLRNRSIIPPRDPDPRSTFLTITDINLYTKDDPILRFLPSVKTDCPTEINWYEGTAMGDRPFDARDTIDKIFLTKCRQFGKEDAGRRFLGIGDEHLDSRFLKESEKYKASNERKNTLASFFCNVCLIFNCGFHTINPGRVLKYNETDGCICNYIRSHDGANREKKDCCNGNQPEDDHSGYVTRNMPCRSAYLPSTTSGTEFLSKNALYLSLKGCVIKMIADLIDSPLMNMDCCELPNEKIPIKAISNSTRKTAIMEYFTPCNHTGPCRRDICSCAARGVACELSCFCIRCKNMRYCSCNSDCTLSEYCFCNDHGRECTELCGNQVSNEPDKGKSNEIKGRKPVESSELSRFMYSSNTKSTEKNYRARNNNGLVRNQSQTCNCANRPIQEKIKKSTSIYRSKFHGLGLFSNESIIKKGEFVFEYTGEIISDKEAERRGNFYEINHCSYLFDLVKFNGDCLFSIDAFSLGNTSRYINHSSKDENLDSEVTIVNGLTKIGFRAKRDIYKGEELLFNYRFSEECKARHGIRD